MCLLFSVYNTTINTEKEAHVPTCTFKEFPNLPFSLLSLLLGVLNFKVSLLFSVYSTIQIIGVQEKYNIAYFIMILLTRT